MKGAGKHYYLCLQMDSQYQQLVLFLLMLLIVEQELQTLWYYYLAISSLHFAVALASLD